MSDKKHETEGEMRLFKPTEARQDSNFFDALMGFQYGEGSELEEARKYLFGPKSKGIKVDPNQLDMFALFFTPPRDQKE